VSVRRLSVIPLCLAALLAVVSAGQPCLAEKVKVEFEITSPVDATGLKLEIDQDDLITESARKTLKDHINEDKVYTEALIKAFGDSTIAAIQTYGDMYDAALKKADEGLRAGSKDCPAWSDEKIQGVKDRLGRGDSAPDGTITNETGQDTSYNRVEWQTTQEHEKDHVAQFKKWAEAASGDSGWLSGFRDYHANLKRRTICTYVAKLAKLFPLKILDPTALEKEAATLGGSIDAWEKANATTKKKYEKVWDEGGKDGNAALEAAGRAVENKIRDLILGKITKWEDKNVPKPKAGKSAEKKEGTDNVKK